jgi:hypothetical protein
MEEVRSASMVRLHSLHELPFPGPVPIDLPTETGACSGDDPAALCLRPGEWLLISETIPAPALLQQFGKLIDSEQTSALDSSDFDIFSKVWRPTQAAHLHVSLPASDKLAIFTEKAGVTSLLNHPQKDGI